MYKRNYYNVYKKEAPELSQEEQVAKAKKILTKLGYLFIWDDFNKGPRNQFGFVSLLYLGAITERVRTRGFRGVATTNVLAAIKVMIEEGSEAEAIAQAKSAGSKSRGVKHG